MAQTKEGAIKLAASKLGISAEEYTKHVASGLKNCFRCKQWLNLDFFQADRTRYDGKNPSCTQCRNAYSRSIYKPISDELRKQSGPQPKPARDGDKRQARSRVNHLVQKGKLPRPRDLACVDCGHIGNDRPHEYDHYKGYAGVYHLSVECVCQPCHRNREKQRRLVSNEL